MNRKYYKQPDGYRETIERGIAGVQNFRGGLTEGNLSREEAIQKLKTEIKAAGLSVKDLQDIFGFATPQAIYKWQKGAAMPTIDNLVVLAMVFRVKMDDIIVVDAAADLMYVLMRSA